MEYQPPQLFFRLVRESTGSSITLPASMDNDIDVRTAQRISECLNGEFIPTETYHTRKQLAEKFNYEYWDELDKEDLATWQEMEKELELNDEYTDYDEEYYDDE